MNWRIWTIFELGLAALIAALGCASPAPPNEVSAGRPAMGTVLEITLYGTDLAGLARAREQVFAEV